MFYVGLIVKINGLGEQKF